MELTKAGLGSLLPSLSPKLGGTADAGSPTSSFGNVLSNMVQSTMDSQNAAATASAAAASGDTSVPMTQVVQALSKAELSLQTLITVRDKVVEAFQSIQQMSI